MVRIEPGWKEALAAEWSSDYFAALTQFVKGEYARTQVFPPARRIFAAFDACPFAEVKVVILGQDPYHGPGQADGLCFSVRPGVALPPSLVNIYKEMQTDLGVKGPEPQCGSLDYLAAQGVLLLNSTLTVEAHRAASHAGHGWERFTDAAIEALSTRREGIVFLLWGSYAIRKGERIDRSRHLVLTAPHPSPLSAYRGFFGCHHFSLANDYLVKHGKTPVQWLPQA